MVFCSAEGRSIPEGTPGNGQSTIFSSADPLRGSPFGLGIERINGDSGYAFFKTRRIGDFPTLNAFA
jgi:hypothetical protein